MSLRTKLFQQFPWIGGVNTSLDPAMIPKNQLINADNLLFDTRGSRKIREGIDFNFDDASNTTNSIVGLHDFFFTVSGVKTSRLIAVSTIKEVYFYSSGGNRTTITLDGSGTPWASTVTKASFTTINNLAIIAVDGTDNLMRKWAGEGNNLFDLGGTPPKASILQQHLGRVWCNDKTDPDRLHYSTTANPEEWNGTGDSGALDIGVGDGDPGGITAIFPTFKGDLFVAKRTKLYRISGFTPESFQVSKVSDGIGCVSNSSVTAIDQDDLVFVSERGIHSLATTANFGDFSAKFLSADIQKSFNEEFDINRLDQIWGAYLPTINSVAFAVTDITIGAGENNTVWLYNIPLQSWYRWPNVDCESMIVVNDADRKRFYFGTTTERIGRSFNGVSRDVDTAGVEVAIPMTIKTGLIFKEDDPYSISGFKKFALIYAPVGTHTVIVTFKIDNFPDQTLTFNTTTGLDLLGTTLILGSSTLGSNVVVAPFAQQVDGYGRGFQVTMTLSGVNQEVEIQGFAVEYEVAETQQEVVIPG